MPAPDARKSTALSLRDVADIVMAAGDVNESANVKRLSAINSVARWTEEWPEDIPATVEELRQRFGSLGPARCGVTEQHMRNVKAALLSALRLAGLVEEKITRRKLSPTYVKVASGLSKTQRIQLCWVMGEASHQGLEPDSVSAGLFDLYEEILRKNTLRPNPRRTRRAAERLWIQKVGPIMQLAPTDRPQLADGSKASIDADDLNPAYLADLDAYLNSQASDDIMDLSARDEPLRPATLRSYEYNLKRAARILQARGHARDAVSSLSYVTQVSNAEEILRHILAQPSSPRLFAGNVAAVLATVAKYWVGRPEDDVKTLREFARRLRKGVGKGLSNRNRRRVAQFRDPVNLAKLFLLPRTAAERLDLRRTLNKRQAREMLLILVLYILTYCPLRIRTITELRLDHLVWSQSRMRGQLTLEINGDLIKNREPVSYPLAKDVADFVRLYLKHARPILAPSGSPFLFPQSNPEKPRHPGQLSTDVRHYIFNCIGLEVTPHVFRHLVHIVVLRRFPGAYALVARVCGHADLNTTLLNYATEDAAIAMEIFQELVSEHVNGTSPASPTQSDALAYGLNQGM